MQTYSKYKVSGLFAEGSGGDLSEDMGAMKSYMLSKMVWNTTLANSWQSLMAEFLQGYYAQAAPAIRAYMELMHRASITALDPVKMFEVTGRFDKTRARMTYLDPDTMLQAGAIFKAAKPQVSGLYLTHVNLAAQPTVYVTLTRWEETVKYAKQHAVSWPFLPTKRAQFDAFARLYNTTGDSHVDIRNTLYQFELALFAPPPPDKE